jgi:hypothetical protein
MKAHFAYARLLIDIFSVKLLVALCGRNGVLLDSHLFFYHRYFELAEYHELRGHVANAAKFDAIAEAHFQAAPGEDDDHPPTAEAMAMPVPQPPIVTNAVSTTRMTRSPFRKSDVVIESREAVTAL